MKRMATTWRWLRRLPRERGAELRLCLRMTTAAVLSLAVAHLLHLPIALWTVLTAVILTQMSVGRSLKATTDYLVGTLGGAIYAGAIGTLVPHDNEVALLAALALAVAPAALIVAINPRYSAATFTAVMVFFGPTITHAGPIASAVERVIEVAVGGVVGLFVSLVVLPARAHDLAVEAAAQMIDLMARFLPELFAGFTRDLDQTALHAMQNRIGAAFARLDAVAVEAKHERMTRLAAEPDQAPLLRTLLRLRHDLIMIGRAAAVPLPATFRSRLAPQLARIQETAADYLRACSGALVARQGPASLVATEAALDGYDAEFAAMRREGLTRDLSDETAERLFALGFALEQLRRNFSDLGRCITELKPTDSASVAKVAEPSPKNHGCALPSSKRACRSRARRAPVRAHRPGSNRPRRTMRDAQDWRVWIGALGSLRHLP
jgi:uncharacterized membrane protein YccC